jgi:hypothetical protein
LTNILNIVLIDYTQIKESYYDKKTKTYLKEVQEKYIENDLFRVILGLFISSVSFSTLLLLPEKLIEEISMTDMGEYFFYYIYRHGNNNVRINTDNNGCYP